MNSQPSNIRSLAWFSIIIYLFLGLIWCFGNMFVWWMGPCPAFSSNTVCEWSRLKELWHFPISQIAYLAIGGVLLFAFKRYVR
jgi:hypothetical protein